MPDNKPSKIFDSRKYQGQIERELILGGILITLVVGGGLIYLIWGQQPFIAAMGCFALIGVLIVIIWGFLKIIEIASRSD